MSSSDSEDDYYSNATKRLQNLKNNYSEDKIETANLLKDISVQPLLETCGNTAVSICSLTPIVETEINKDDSLYEDDVVLDDIIALNSFKRTRSQTKKGAIVYRTGTTPVGRPRVSKKQSKLSKNSNTEVLSNNFNVASARRTVAQRGCRSLNIEEDQTSQRNMENIQITFSVGNTDEYQDLSDNVQLFNTKPLTQEVGDPFDDNEEQSVKVYWRSFEIVKFRIRKFQKILQIYEFFSKKENVTTDKLLFTYNDKILNPNDTPDKINYNITKFIEGGITHSMPIILDSNEKFSSGLKLKFRCQNAKKPFIICVEKEEKLLQAMVKCAEHFEKPFNALKFVFDGDAISGSMTPDELDLEGGECIDVKFVGE